jgi:hypothetical protein
MAGANVGEIAEDQDERRVMLDQHRHNDDGEHQGKDVGPFNSH